MSWKAPYPEQEPSQLDWVRLAAYIDGEGCVSITASKSKSQNWANHQLQLVVGVTNTDPRLTEWCAKTFGGYGRVEPRKNERWKPCCRWNAASRKAEWILKNCLPYFIIKREQAEIALAFMNTNKRWGVKGMPDEIRAHRWALKETLSGLKDRYRSINYRQSHAPELEIPCNIERTN